MCHPAALDREVAVQGLEQNLWDLWSNFGRGRDAHLIDFPNELWFQTPVDAIPYNSVLRFARSDSSTDQRIDAILGHYRRAGRPVLWLVHPSALPCDLDQRLAARGLEHAETLLGMVARLDSLPDPAGETVDADIREVTDQSGRVDVASLIAWRYDLDGPGLRFVHRCVEDVGIGWPGNPTRAWVAYVGGQPMAKALLHDDGDFAGLYGVATRPEARGRGLARELTLRAFAAARHEGREIGVLHATPMAMNLYRSLGFTSVADFRLMAEPGNLRL